MVPKPLQNQAWRGSGGDLGATLETRCFQDLIFDDFGSSLGPLWDHFGFILGIIFLMFFFKQKTAYEIGVRLVGSEMCIRDRARTGKLVDVR